MMTKNYSKYQTVIYVEYTTTNNNIVVMAGPGSGKSFMIQELLKVTPKFKKSILCAFNKSIKDELENKVPQNVKVKTIHGLAYSILLSNVNKRFKLNEFKNFILGKKYLDLKNIQPKNRDVYLFTISKIVNLSRLNLAKTRDDIEDICDKYNISTINGEIDNAIELIEHLDKYNNSQSDEIMIDFTDQLYLAYTMVKPENFPKYSVVFVDELQDLTPLQKVIIERIIAPIGGRFVGVGDKKQSIYSFLGANSQAFDSFMKRPRTVTLPLSITYRCSKKIVEEANKIFEGLEAFENNEEGIVRKGTLDEVSDGDFVICRNNLPLVEAWISIIKQGKRAHILGKDFGKSLCLILNKLSDYSNFEEGVKLILEKKESELKEKGHPNPKASSSFQSLVEKLSILTILKKEFNSFELMQRNLDNIFDDNDKGGIILMTGHKSKGLEAKRVFFLKRELIPSKYATTIQELYQEKCLLFVIITRAKNELVYVD